MAPLRLTGDPGWEHGVAQDEKKKKVKCNYCEKIVSGGIYRLKQHLARVSGEVTHCKKAPEEVAIRMKENLDRTSKRQRQTGDGQTTYFDVHVDNEDQDESIGCRHKGKQVVSNRSVIAHMTPLRSLGFVDPGWEHGVPQDEKKKKVKCNYCGRIVSGGINRFKQHLARIPGEVASCEKAPDEVYLKIKENMKWHRTGRRQRKPECNEMLASFTMPSDEEEHYGKSEETLLIGDKTLDASCKAMRKRCRMESLGSDASGTEQESKKLKLNSVLNRSKIQTPLSNKQNKVKDSLNKISRKEVISSICKFFYHAAIPFDAANSPYFHRMVELVGQYGAGLKAPSIPHIYGRCLQDEISTIKEHLVELKATWVTTGCTIMADRWKDAQSRSLINFFVSCPRGVYFASSVNVTDIVEDSASIFKLLDKVVEEMGEENVVQVITENTACFKAAGKMLEEKRRNLFWTPCVVYCTDRIFEDFLKIKWVGECMDKAKIITKFIYNRSWLLSLMKEYSDGKDLIRPAVTKFASSFATLQCLLDHRANLKRMFQSNKWMSSPLAKLEEGKEVEKIVLNSTFWKKMQYVSRSVVPILQLFQKVNSGCLMISSIYNDMYRAKFTIKAIHGDDVQKFGPFWNVIDNHWMPLFHHPLLAAAYFLNPSYRYHTDFLTLPEVIRGLNECIVRLEPDNGRRICASMQISDFVSAKADFGTELAISTRMELDPAAWWQQHGINCLELQRLAVRILSQTCSSFSCEHDFWNTFEQLQRQRQNRLARKRLNDLLYVHYNLCAKGHQFRRKSDDSASLDSIRIENLLEDWIVESEKTTFQEDEETLYIEMEQADTDENDMICIEDVDPGPGRDHLEMSLTEVVEPLDVHTTLMGVNPNDDDGLNFLDADISD